MTIKIPRVFDRSFAVRKYTRNEFYRVQKTRFVERSGDFGRRASTKLFEGVSTLTYSASRSRRCLSFFCSLHHSDFALYFLPSIHSQIYSEIVLEKAPPYRRWKYSGERSEIDSYDIRVLTRRRIGKPFFSWKIRQGEKSGPKRKIHESGKMQTPSTQRS